MLRFASLLFALAIFQVSALAQECNPMRIVVGLSAGGGTDAVARMLAQRMTTRFGRPVIVENRVGASGNIAAGFVAKSPKDGCTLALRGSEHHSNLFAFERPGYTAQDFVPVSRVVNGPTLILASANQPFKSIGSLVEYAKANPGKLSYGTSGVGGSTHVAMELFLRAAKAQMVHVPYKGGAASLADAAGGVLPVVISGVAAAVPFIQSGKLIPLSVSTPKRWAALPNVPTLNESGLRDGTVEYWMGLLVPAGTPLAIREKLNQEVRAILEEPAIIDRLTTMGYEPAGGAIADYEKFLQEDLRVAAKLMQELKLKLD